MCALKNALHSFLADGFNSTHGYVIILQSAIAKKSSNSLQDHKNTNRSQVLSNTKVFTTYIFIHSS